MNKIKLLNKPFKYVSLLALLFMIVACGGSGSKSQLKSADDLDNPETVAPIAPLGFSDPSEGVPLLDAQPLYTPVDVGTREVRLPEGVQMLLEINEPFEFLIQRPKSHLTEEELETGFDYKCQYASTQLSDDSEEYVFFTEELLDPGNAQQFVEHPDSDDPDNPFFYVVQDCYSSTSQIVRNGDLVTIRVRTSPLPNESFIGRVNYGSVSETFTVKTADADITPDIFVFEEVLAGNTPDLLLGSGENVLKGLVPNREYEIYIQLKGTNHPTVVSISDTDNRVPFNLDGNGAVVPLDPVPTFDHDNNPETDQIPQTQNVEYKIASNGTYTTENQNFPALSALAPFSLYRNVIPLDGAVEPPESVLEEIAFLEEIRSQNLDSADLVTGMPIYLKFISPGSAEEKFEITFSVGDQSITLPVELETDTAPALSTIGETFNDTVVSADNPEVVEITVGAINESIPFEVSGEALWCILPCSDGRTAAPGIVQPYEVIRLFTPIREPDTTVISTLTVGSDSDAQTVEFVYHTESADMTPDEFNLVGGSIANLEYFVEALNITGINTLTEFTAEGGQLSLNGGQDWLTSGELPGDGDSLSVLVRVQAGSERFVETQGVFTIGGVSATMTVVSTGGFPPSGEVIFPPQNALTVSDSVYVRIKGIPAVEDGEPIVDTIAKVIFSNSEEVEFSLEEQVLSLPGDNSQAANYFAGYAPLQEGENTLSIALIDEGGEISEAVILSVVRGTEGLQHPNVGGQPDISIGQDMDFNPNTNDLYVLQSGVKSVIQIDLDNEQSPGLRTTLIDSGALPGNLFGLVYNENKNRIAVSSSTSSGRLTEFNVSGEEPEIISDIGDVGDEIGELGAISTPQQLTYDPERGYYLVNNQNGQKNITQVDEGTGNRRTLLPNDANNGGFKSRSSVAVVDGIPGDDGDVYYAKQHNTGRLYKITAVGDHDTLQDTPPIREEILSDLDGTFAIDYSKDYNYLVLAAADTLYFVDLSVEAENEPVYMTEILGSDTFPADGANKFTNITAITAPLGKHYVYVVDVDKVLAIDLLSGERVIVSQN